MSRILLAGPQAQHDGREDKLYVGVALAPVLLHVEIPTEGQQWEKSAKEAIREARLRVVRIFFVLIP